MKKTFLENMFKKSNSTSFNATVVRRIRKGRYQLQDDSGNLFQADSSIHWIPGSRVSVQNDRILTGGGSVPNIKTYQV